MILQGLYIGEVLKLDTNEENKRDRIYCRVVGLHDMKSSNGIWIEPGMSDYYTSGNVPPVGSFVLVMFMHNDCNKAYYFGQIKYNIEG